MLTAGMELIPLQSNTPITASQNLALEGRKEGWKGRKPHTTQRTEHRGDCGRIWAGQGRAAQTAPYQDGAYSAPPCERMKRCAASMCGSEAASPSRRSDT